MKNNYDFNNDTYNEILEKIFLTNLEKEIINLKRKYADEWNNSRIALELNISERKLYNCMKKITNKIIDYIGTQL